MQFHQFLDGGTEPALQLKISPCNSLKWEWQSAPLLEYSSRQQAKVTDTHE